VTDSAGRPVIGLPQDAFEVFDNGQPRPIAAYTSDVQPVAVRVLLDLSDSVLTSAPAMRVASLKLIERMHAGDQLSFSTLRSLGRLRTNADELLADLSGLDLDGGYSLIWQAVQEEVLAMKEVPGRRALLLATDGIDASDRLGIPSDYNRSLGLVFLPGFRSEVRKGLTGLGMDVQAIQVYVAAIGKLDKRSELRTLSAETGGYVVDTGSKGAPLENVFANALDDLRHQYAIGFTPLELDGKTHTISVRVNRPGVTVRHRSTYVSGR
jgi:VWFA-related protein